MPRRPHLLLIAAVATASLLVAAPSDAAPAAPAAATAASSRYLVVADEAAPLDQVARAVTAAHGRIVSSTPEVAVLVAESDDPGFATALSGVAGVTAVARDAAIGRTGAPPAGATRHRNGWSGPGSGRDAGAQPTPEARPGSGSGNSAGGVEPLAADQWDLEQIGVTRNGRRIAPAGDRRVSVAVLDSGLDWTHPEIARFVDRATSRDFRTYDPSIDDACLVACDAPLGVDPVGHGTAMASLIGAARDGFGMQGVAPGVTLVDLRIGQPTGWVLAAPVVSALVYAANNRINVANLSFSIDPWVFNCPSNRADSPAEQAEQRGIIQAVTRATRYARARGTTVVAAAGNENNDLNDPGVDVFSPDIPVATATTRDRTLAPDECLYLPAMAPGVITVAGTDQAADKSDLSNYGRAVDIAAPAAARAAGSAPIVQAISREGAINNGWLDGTTGEITGPLIQQCQGPTCAWYVRIGGTSDSTAEVSGAAALVIGRRGSNSGGGGGGGDGRRSMEPAAVESRLYRTARAHACPATDPVYTSLPPFLDQTAHCYRTPAGNSFYGAGIVDAAAAA